MNLKSFAFWPLIEKWADIVQIATITISSVSISIQCFATSHLGKENAEIIFRNQKDERDELIWENHYVAFAL